MSSKKNNVLCRRTRLKNYQYTSYASHSDRELVFFSLRRLQNLITKIHIKNSRTKIYAEANSFSVNTSSPDSSEYIYISTYIYTCVLFKYPDAMYICCTQGILTNKNDVRHVRGYSLRYHAFVASQPRASIAPPPLPSPPPHSSFLPRATISIPQHSPPPPLRGHWSHDDGMQYHESTVPPWIRAVKG